jgi:hypothetical protein
VCTPRWSPYFIGRSVLFPPLGMARCTIEADRVETCRAFLTRRSILHVKGTKSRFHPERRSFLCPAYWPSLISRFRNISFVSVLLYRCSKWYPMLTMPLKILFANAADPAPGQCGWGSFGSRKRWQCFSIMRSCVVCLAISRMEAGDFVTAL